MSVLERAVKEAAERRQSCNGERGSPTVNGQDVNLGDPEQSGSRAEQNGR